MCEFFRILHLLLTGESDTESLMCPSPMKSSQNSDDVEELKKLRQIQEEEGTILGYSLSPPQELENKPLSDSDEFVEEVSSFFMKNHHVSVF